MNIKTTSPTKLEGYLFALVYGITFIRLAWLMAEGADPRPILFLMAYCAVWFFLISLITYIGEKNLQKTLGNRRNNRRSVATHPDPEIGRAHVGTPVPNAHLECRLR